MCRLSVLLRVSTAILFLVLGLQLEIIKAQENLTKRKPIIFSLETPQTARKNDFITAKLMLKTELRECMVVKAYLLSDVPMEGAFNYKQTACLCDDYPKTFYWDFYINRTTQITAVVDIVRELDICPDNIAVIPIEANRYRATQAVYVL